MNDISVIIPVFNHSKYLSKCIESACQQSNRARCVICVDNDSTDPAVKPILENLRKKYDSLRVIFMQKNLGICEAQNVALEANENKFVAFLDCDDFLHPRAIALMSKYIAECPDAAYFFSDRVDIDENDGVIARRVYGGQPRLLGRGHRENLLDHMIASHLKVINAEVIRSIGGFVPGTDGTQDWDLALKISEKFELIYVPEALYYHRIHPSAHSSYSKVANMQKTNVIRRTAQIRRFASFPLDGHNPKLPLVADKSVWRDSHVLKEMSLTGMCIALTETDEIRMCPIIEPILEKFTAAQSIKEILVFSASWIDPDPLKSFWRVRRRPLVGYYFDLSLGTDCADFIRWNNSYFDYVVCGSNSAVLSILDYCHPDLMIFISGCHGVR